MSIKQFIKIMIVASLLTIGVPVNALEATTSSTFYRSEKQTKLSIEDYKTMDATQLAEMVRNKQITSEELVNLAFEVNEIENPKTNALITTRKEEALKEASELTDTGQPFFGVPIVVKGLGHTIAGGSNSNGLIFNKDVTTKGTGRLVKSLQDLGFIVIGQSNYPQLGFKNISDSALYGPTGSAWNPNFQAGGSSGGSAAAVASGVTPIASGSDAGGSIRIPASWNGLVGLKPSRGIIKANPKTGQVVHFPLTKTMEDTQNLFTHLIESKEDLSTSSLDNIKIGYTTTSPVGTPVSEDAKQAVMNAVTFLKSKGFDVQEVNLPFDGKKLMQGYYDMATGSGTTANYLATQTLKRNMTIDDVDLLTWGLFRAGKLVTKDDINNANAYNEEVKQNMEQLYQEFPLILTPTTASTAPELNDPLITPEHIEQMKHIDELHTKEERMNLIYDQWLTALTYTPFTQLANLTGQPAISLPTYVSDNHLPMGIQFNAATNHDQLLIDMGKLFEDNNQFKQINTNQELEENKEVNLDTQTSESKETSTTSIEPTETHIMTSESNTIESTTTSSSTEMLKHSIENTDKDSSTESTTTLTTSLKETTSTIETTSSTSIEEANTNGSELTESSSQPILQTKKTVLKPFILPKTGEVILKFLPIIGLLIIISVIGLFIYKKKN